MDKEYRVRQVQARKPYNTQYGEFQPYGLQLDGWANGWVELSQKPETKPPVVGDVLFGHIEKRTVDSKTGGDPMVFYKFKKGDLRDAPSSQSTASNPSKEADMAYIIQMLEELTGRREKPSNPTGRDNVPEEILDGDPFELEDDPFKELGV